MGVMTLDIWENLQPGDTFTDLDGVNTVTSESNDEWIVVSAESPGGWDRWHRHREELGWLGIITAYTKANGWFPSVPAPGGACCDSPDIYTHNPIGFFEVTVCRNCKAGV